MGKCLNVDNTIATECIAGRLKSFYTNWEQITSDPYILSAISGYKLEFEIAPPIQTWIPRPFKLNQCEMHAIDIEIQRLIDKGVIEFVDHEVGEFLSNIFCRPKKDGNHRMILDLSRLNEHLTFHHFKMESFELAT